MLSALVRKRKRTWFTTSATRIPIHQAHNLYFKPTNFHSPYFKFISVLAKLTVPTELLVCPSVCVIYPPILRHSRTSLSLLDVHHLQHFVYRLNPVQRMPPRSSSSVAFYCIRAHGRERNSCQLAALFYH